MTLLLYSCFKVITTLCVIWPFSSFLTEKIAERYMYNNKRLPDLIQIITIRMRRFVKPCSRIKDIAAFAASVYGATVCILYSFELFDSFVNFMCGIVLIRCLFFIVTVLPSSSARAYSKSRLERILVGGCHDLVFSGHVTYNYCALLFLQYHGFIELGLFPFWSSVFIGVISVILRDHYTIDVLVAFPVVWVWKDYMLERN